MKHLVTIVPPAPNGHGIALTNGTVVLLPDGSKMPGVTKVTIEGAVNDVWRARIECIANIPVFPGVTLDEVESSKPLTWWRRVLLRAAGVRALDVTTLADREYQRTELLKCLRVRPEASAKE